MTELTVRRGDTNTLAMTIVDGSGQPVDLSGYAILFSAKRDYRDIALISKSVGSGIAVTGMGACTITLLPADTYPLAIDRVEALLWDVEITAGDVVRTPLSGRLVVQPDVGRAGEA